MHYLYRIITCLIIVFLTVSCTKCTTGHPEPNIVEPKDTDQIDMLELIYKIADEKGMHVISELNMQGGDIFQKYNAEYVESQHKIFIQQYYKRYGNHPSFWGWYLGNELNPLRSDEEPISDFWRKVWKSAVQECKRVAPESMVTISPFFILDENEYRGYEYLPPVEYEKWWAKTLTETGIDILMIQDSGAEHLGFFTLENRRPFFQALKNACDQSGSKLWINVETGEVAAKNWTEAINMERTDTQKWVYTQTEWLSQKLALAAEYGEHIINWGYYPFMFSGLSIGPYPSDNTPIETRESNYASYKAYYEQQLMKPKPSKGPVPIMRGTLWWLPAEVSGLSTQEFENSIRFQIEKQAEIGFDILWIVNAPANMQWAIDKENGIK